MSPEEISTQFNSRLPLVQTLSGPSLVAIAPVEPMSAIQTYLGSQCQVQVQIGARSALSLLPGYNELNRFYTTLSGFFQHLWRRGWQLLHK